MDQAAEKYDSDSQDNAAATATIPDPGGAGCVFVSHISASFSAAPSSPVLLQLKEATTVLMEWYVSTAEGLQIVFENPIKLKASNAANAVLAASGTGGTVGKVNIAGFVK